LLCFFSFLSIFIIIVIILSSERGTFRSSSSESFTSQSSDDDDDSDDDDVNDDDEDERVVVVFTISERRFLFAHHHHHQNNGTPVWYSSRGGGAQKPKRYFSLSLSLSQKNTSSGKSFKGKGRVVCARLCRRNAQRERERKECALHRAMMTMQNSSFFLSGVVVECKKRREKKFF
jgi:hypothetical protein